MKTDRTICLNSKVNGKQPSLADRVYDVEGLYTAVTCCFHPNIIELHKKNITNKDIIAEPIRIKEATVKGYAEAYEGDSVNLAVPNSNTRRGRVGKQIGNTLDTGCQQGEVTNYRIRKLTPTECFRLMGVDDTDIDKIQASGISNSQQYKMAGNSIVVDVLYHIFRQAFCEEKPKARYIEQTLF